MNLMRWWTTPDEAEKVTRKAVLDGDVCGLTFEKVVRLGNRGYAPLLRHETGTAVYPIELGGRWVGKRDSWWKAEFEGVEGVAFAKELPDLIKKIQEAYDGKVD